MLKKNQLLLAAIWQLIRHPGLVEAGESVCWYSFCVSWKPLNTHLAFAFFLVRGGMVFVMGEMHNEDSK